MRPLPLWICLPAAAAALAATSPDRPLARLPLRSAPPGMALQVTGPRQVGGLLPEGRPPISGLTPLRVWAGQGKPKIAYSFNPDDDLAAIRRTGFTHVLISYLQGAPDEQQRRKLDECQRHGLRVIYRMVDQVDRDRRTGGDARTRHAVMLLRDHPALAAWQTYEETNLPPETQIAVYRKVKSLDPHHPIIIVTTNEYSEGWYRRTYSDDAQDLVMLDFYPYKRRYDGWPYIRMSVPALLAVQKRPVPIIPIIQASSATQVRSSDDTLWPPPGGLEKQLNLWWSLGADAGVAFWLWKGSRDYPFVGLADRDAPAHALPETRALLARIADGDLPVAHGSWLTAHGDGTHGTRRTVHGSDKLNREPRTVSREPITRELSAMSLPAVRVRPPTVNHLKNSGFERGLEGWSGYSKQGVLADQARTGRRAARLVNEGTPVTIGLVQRTDLLVPPLGSVTFSFYYRVQRETTRLQATIDTTAYPRFGAAAFVERRERLPAGEWRRGSLTATNSTGTAQRVKGVSVTSHAFTGDVLLDDLQLELGQQAGEYTTAREPGYTAAVRGRTGRTAVTVRYLLADASQEGRSPLASGARHLASAKRGWTLCGWSAPEVAPEPDSYVCLAALESVDAPSVMLRLRVDPARSDPNGWVGWIEAVSGESTINRLPVALAPGQALFWALTGDTIGGLRLRAAPAGYRLRSSLNTGTKRLLGGARGLFRAIHLGTDARGEHPLNGLVGGGWFSSEPLDEAAIERLMAYGSRREIAAP